MRTRATLLLLLLVGVTSAAADGHTTALARMETGTVAMTNNLLDFYEARVPELAEVRPDMTWDTAFREAGQCILDGLAAHGGDATVASYLTALEDFATVEIATFTDLTTKMPAPLSDPAALELSSTCGMITLGTTRMTESGLQEAFAADGVMERVLAPAE